MAVTSRELPTVEELSVDMQTAVLAAQQAKAQVGLAEQNVAALQAKGALWDAPPMATALGRLRTARRKAAAADRRAKDAEAAVNAAQLVDAVS